MNIRPEKPGGEEVAAIHEVVRLAFGREDEAKLVDDLRGGGYVRLSLVAEREGGGIVGHVLFSEISVVGSGLAALALAPVAVAPKRQGEGIGSALIRTGIQTCADEGYDTIFLLGDPGYYERFGFSAEKAKDFDTPYPKEYFMALELKEGALAGAAGRIEYPPVEGL